MLTREEDIGIGLIGLGVVGGGVARVLMGKADALTRQVGHRLTLRKVLVQSLSKHRDIDIEPSFLTAQPEEIIGRSDVDIVVEVMGGEHPAVEYIRQSLANGKRVVTANKEVMAKYGYELLALAQEHRVALHYEASVGGGIPLVAPFQRDLAANDISAIYAIVNGTTNYILTQMSQEGLDFSLALSQAQSLGYAEAEPSNDIDGLDVAYKLAILATLAFGTEVSPEDVYCEGISRLKDRDFRYARELGYTIKLLAIAKLAGDFIEVRVHPVFTPADSLLAGVDGVYNAVQVEGDLVGKVVFYGEGAGSLPTSSSVVADIIAVAQNIAEGVDNTPRLPPQRRLTIKPMSEIETRYYLRMGVVDNPGVLAQISKVLGDHFISISSVIQKEAEPSTGTAEIVIMTHPARERLVRQALEEAEHLSVVKEVGNFVRVES